jgi:hypothetical protein
MAWKRKTIDPFVSWSAANHKSSDVMGGAPAGAGVVDWLMFAVLAIGVVTLAVAIASSDFGTLSHF